MPPAVPGLRGVCLCAALGLFFHVLQSLGFLFLLWQMRGLPFPFLPWLLLAARRQREAAQCRLSQAAASSAFQNSLCEARERGHRGTWLAASLQGHCFLQRGLPCGALCHSGANWELISAPPGCPAALSPVGETKP